ncbi:MAG TPA: metal-dependent hydrolase, partial [Planctomycetes bacterium]|nr:metal-dependent hydrolase [Planctomycetota bacterium]
PWRAIDTNVSLFHWPFRRLPLDETGLLVQKLKSHAMEQAWAGSFEGLLHLDLAGVNSRLASACREQGDGLLIPFGSVNPTVPDWEEDLRRCHEEHKMPGIRLHPNYHGYSLDDPRFERLMRLAAKREIVVQLATTMEDGRTQHRMLQVADVDLTPLPDLVKRVPGTRLVVLNHKGTGPEFMQLLKIPGVYFDMSRVNATDGVARIIRTLPTGRIVFGTHAPFLIYESAMIKVEESNLTEDETTSILHRNATRLISRDAS